MDAAIAAMHPTGFADKLVRGTVRDLLKVGFFFVCLFVLYAPCFLNAKILIIWLGLFVQVYGGNDGWQFIEENSYLLLIETILEKTKAPQEEVNFFLYMLDFFYC